PLQTETFLGLLSSNCRTSEARSAPIPIRSQSFLRVPCAFAREPKTCLRADTYTGTKDAKLLSSWARGRVLHWNAEYGNNWPSFANEHFHGAIVEFNRER